MDVVHQVFFSAVWALSPGSLGLLLFSNHIRPFRGIPIGFDGACDRFEILQIVAGASASDACRQEFPIFIGCFCQTRPLWPLIGTGAGFLM